MAGYCTRALGTCAAAGYHLAGNRASPAAAATTPEQGEMTENLNVDSDEFNLAVDVLYHRARADALMSFHRWAVFLQIVFGSGTIAATRATWICGLLVVAIGAAEIAFDWAGRSVDHRKQMGLYLELVAKLRNAKYDDDVRTYVRTQTVLLTNSEPLEFRLARKIAYNKAMDAYGIKGIRQKVSWYFRPFAQIYRFDDD